MLRRLRPLSLAIGVALAAATLSRGVDVEQTSPGDRSPPIAVASFDGLGVGFSGPQGAYAGRNPSDNSLAVGPDHIVQIVNSRMAIYTKKGSRFAAPLLRFASNIHGSISRPSSPLCRNST
jgi:hypothetical protein